MSLTQPEIESLKNDWINTNVSFYETYILDRIVCDYLRKLSVCDVIEIGPGQNPVVKEWNCKSYRGVQPFEPVPISDNLDYPLIREDGLTYLRKQEKSSAVVISFGVLDANIMCPLFTNITMHEQYMRELAEEIKRVSDPFAIIIGSGVDRFLGDPNIYAAHFHGAGCGGIYSFERTLTPPSPLPTAGQWQ